jgi:hypothetical protein
MGKQHGVHSKTKAVLLLEQIQPFALQIVQSFVFQYADLQTASPPDDTMPHKNKGPRPGTMPAPDPIVPL